VGAGRARSARPDLSGDIREKGMTADQALLLEYLDIPAEIEAEFNAWYNAVRLPKHLEVPGVLSAHRYATREASPKYVTVYEVDHSLTFYTPAFQAQAREAVGAEGARFLDAATHYSRRHHALIEPRPEDASPFPEATTHLLTAGASPAPEYEHDFNDDYNMT